MNKIPITDFQKGNCCPECGSKKVVLYVQYPLVVMYNKKGNKIFTDYVTGKKYINHPHGNWQLNILLQRIMNFNVRIINVKNVGG